MSSEATLLDRAYMDLTSKTPPLPDDWNKIFSIVREYTIKDWVNKLGAERSLRVLCHAVLNVRPEGRLPWEKSHYYDLIGEFIARILEIRNLL